MKQPFVIVPRRNRAAATIQTHRYDPKKKRSKTVYIGCVRRDTPLSALDNIQEVAPGELAAGIRLSVASPMRLHRSDVLRIREWLDRNGTYQDAEEQARAALYEAAEGALAQAAQGLEDAAQLLVHAVASARQHGETLTNRRSQRMQPGAAASTLDVFQARANRVRLAAFERFTAACQDAGLMERRARSDCEKGATASRPGQR